MYKSIKELKAQKPSERAQFALDALEEMEKSDLYRVDMGIYHNFTESICFACLGGAAAIKAIKGSFKERTEIIGQYQLRLILDVGVKSEVHFFVDFEDSINSLRMGDVGDAFGLMGYSEMLGDRFNRVIADYMNVSPELFKKDFRKLIKDLREAGY